MNKAFIPALRYHFLTPLYDAFIRLTMPETEVKTKLIDFAVIDQKQEILDFGCGTGTSLKIFTDKYPNINIIGIDIDKRMLEVAKKKISNRNITLVLYDGGVLPFENQKFDVIFSSWVFHHFTTSQKKEAFKELKRVLKPNANLLIADWGKPANKLMRVLFFLLQLADNFTTTKDNVEGKISTLMKAEGFCDVSEIGHKNTIFGTLRYYSATNPKN